MFWSNYDNFTANLGVNMVEHASEVELYIILATLGKFVCWNQSFNPTISAGQMTQVQSSPKVDDISRLFFFIDEMNILSKTH